MKPLFLIFLIVSFVISSKQIDFEEEYNYIGLVDNINIYPLNGNFSKCISLSELPLGITLDETTCRLAGVPQQFVNNFTVFISADLPEPSEGIFQLNVNPCQSNAFEILRTYGNSNVNFEVFSVVDYYTGETLVNVTADTPKKSGSSISYRFCSPTRTLQIHVDSITYNNWYTDSKLEVYALLNNNPKDLLLTCRMDKLAGLPTNYLVDVTYAFNLESTWNYYMNSLPPNWESSSFVPSWDSGSVETFPVSSNQIQLYKLGFLIHDHESSMFELDLHYQAGCIVYINGYEVFRDHLPEGPLLNTTLATAAYKTLDYRRIVLSSLYKESSTWSSIFIPGRNVITIAIIGLTNEGFLSQFDASLRFIGDDHQYRRFNMHSQLIGIQGQPEAILDGDYETWIDMKGTCTPSASIILQFNETRRERISRFVLVNYFHDLIPGPSGFTLYGRINNQTQWEKIKEVHNITWRSLSQQVQFWIHSTQAYNMFMFTHFQGKDNDCTWRLTEILMFTDQMDRPIPSLCYSSTFLYTETSIGVLEPSSSDYDSFSIQPALPQGLLLDTMDGTIRGSPLDVVNKVYTILATRFDGEMCSTEWYLQTQPCSNGRSLYHINILTDRSFVETYWEIYEGYTTEDPLYYTSGPLIRNNEMISTALCLPDGVYTFFFVECSGSGWSTPSGYSIATNHNHLRIATGTLPRYRDQSWSNTTVTIQTFQPSQPRTTVWHIYPDGIPQSNWKTLDFNDYDWLDETTAVLSSLTHSIPTYYLRNRFVLDKTEEYSLLHIQLHYSGGIAIYFNGRKVYQQNLVTHPLPTDYAYEDHNNTIWTKFSIPLIPYEIREGENLIAVELHKAHDSIQFIDFDCIATFAMNSEDPVTVNLATLRGSQPYGSEGGRVSHLFDMKAYTTYRPRMAVGTYWQWSLENDIHIGFNQYSILAGNYVGNHTWTLSGRYEHEKEWIVIDKQVNKTLSDREPTVFKVPQAMAGFKEFLYEIVGDPNVYVFELSQFFMMYSPPTLSTMCHTYGSYLAVDDGECSYAHCPYGYTGIASRCCHQSQWSNEDISQCHLIPPSSLNYPVSTLRIAKLAVLNPISPSVQGILLSYTITPALPEGLILTNTGVIYGVPTQAMNRTEFSIQVSNQAGTDTFIMTIEVYDRYCPATVACPETKVGDICTFPCRIEFQNTAGMAHKECNADGPTTAVWGKAYGNCTSVSVLTGFIFLCIALVVGLLIFCSSFIVKTINKMIYNHYVTPRSSSPLLTP